MQRYLEPQSGFRQTAIFGGYALRRRTWKMKVVKVKATVRAGVAASDDHDGAVASRKSRAFSPLGGLGGKGWVYAATADMSLWSHTGKLLRKEGAGLPCSLCKQAWAPNIASAR